MIISEWDNWRQVETGFFILEWQILLNCKGGNWFGFWLWRGWGGVGARPDLFFQDQEYTELLEKNIERLIARVKEFRIAEKLLSVFFAVLFLWIQATDEDLDMRKGSRMRLRRRQETSKNE